MHQVNLHVGLLTWSESNSTTSSQHAVTQNFTSGNLLSKPEYIRHSNAFYTSIYMTGIQPMWCLVGLKNLRSKLFSFTQPDV